MQARRATAASSSSTRRGRTNGGDFLVPPQRRNLFSPLIVGLVAKAVVLAGDKARVAPVKATLVTDRPRGGGNNWRGQRIEMTESELDEVAFLTGSYSLWLWWWWQCGSRTLVH